MAGDNKKFIVANGLSVSGDTEVTGSIHANAFFGDGSGLTNVGGGAGGGLSEDAVISVIESTVDAAFVQDRQSVDQLTSSQVELIIEQIVDDAYVAARETGIDAATLAQAIEDGINSRLQSLEWSFGETITAPNYCEGVSVITGEEVSLNPKSGSMVSHVMSADTTYSCHTSWASGESVTLHFTNANGSTVTWPSDILWVGGEAPDVSSPEGVHLVNIWKVGASVYGAYIGQASMAPAE